MSLGRRDALNAQLLQSLYWIKKLINNLTHLYVGMQLNFDVNGRYWHKYSPYLLKKRTGELLHAVDQKKRSQCMWDLLSNCTLMTRNILSAHLQHLCPANIHDKGYSSVAHLAYFEVNAPTDQKLRTMRYRTVTGDQRCLGSNWIHYPAVLLIWYATILTHTNSNYRIIVNETIVCTSNYVYRPTSCPNVIAGDTVGTSTTLSIDIALLTQII
jgi:hypothetical protein